MDQESDWFGYNRVHVALYRVALRKRRLLRRDGAQICIVTGPRIELAIGLIARMKGFFNEKLIVTFDSKETIIELNGIHIEAYPSHHLDAMRGLPNVSFILLDEADFFPPGQQQDARDVSERYIGKIKSLDSYGLNT